MNVTYQNGWAVPAGWKLVPVEPTYELECEVGGVRMNEEFFLYEYADHEKIGEICRAVVKYSPPPPKAPDYNPGPLDVSVVGMPEFDALLDHIYEEGTSSEGVVHLANKLVRAAIQSHMRYARNAQPVAYQWGGVLIRAEESHPVHRKEGRPLYAAPVPTQQAEPATAQDEREVRAWPDVAGIGRDSEHPRAVVLYLRHEPSDEHLRTIQEALRTRPAQPAINGYTCTVPDDCETLHWRGQILSMNELASMAQPAVGEEIMVNAAHDVYTLQLQPSGLDGSGPRFVVHVPARPAPDVSALVEALELARRTLAMAAIEGEVTRRIDSALAAHRKQGGGA